MEIVAIETPTLGNRSYVVLHDGYAIAVDPPRDVDRVTDVLEDRCARLRLVVETHLHADYVSGGLELARRFTATYGVPVGGPEPRFVHHPVRDRTSFDLGDLTVTALHTPGHTPHHQAYVLASPAGEAAVFTGGSLLAGGVGRTDLFGPTLSAPLARDQWRSVRRILREVHPGAVVYATHGFGSPCSAGAATGEATTIADQAASHPAATQSETEFVTALLASYEPWPAFYARLPAVNAAGPAPFDVSPPETVSADELLDRLHRGEWLVDLRGRRTYAGCHLAGSLSFDVGGKLGLYLAWLLPPGTPVTLLADDPELVVRARRELSRVGIDRVAGQALGEPEDWSRGDASRVRTYAVADLADLVLAQRRRTVTVLDVRSRGEHQCGAVTGAVNVPLEEVEARVDEIRSRSHGELWVHCGTGFRAAIAASLLDRAGLPVVLVDDTFTAERWAEVRRLHSGVASMA